MISSIHRLYYLSGLAFVFALAGCTSLPSAPPGEGGNAVFSMGIQNIGSQPFNYSAFALRIRSRNSGQEFFIDTFSSLSRERCEKTGRLEDGRCLQVHTLHLVPGEYEVTGYRIWADWGMWSFEYNTKEPWGHHFTMAKGETVYLGSYVLMYKGEPSDRRGSDMQPTYVQLDNKLASDLATAEKLGNPGLVRKLTTSIGGEAYKLRVGK